MNVTASVIRTRQVREYIENYPDSIIELFLKIRRLIPDGKVEETLRAKLPSYCAGDAFVRLIPFKDHINIEAAAIMRHKDELTGYKLTPKGMLQIYLKDELPEELLKTIFSETLGSEP